MRVLLGHLHGAHDFAGFAVNQGDIVADLDAFVVGRQGDRNGPEQAVGHFVAIAHTLPVSMRHEAVERREAADAQHDKVAGFA